MAKLNELQQIDLEILSLVIEICERHKLRYYALGGTLLGAVRHKGFIPWDDDVDIAMPRPDYDTFLDVCQKELPDRYVVQNYRTIPDDPAPTYMSRIGRKGTSVTYGVASVAKEMPIWIDIFPLDAMPSKKFLRVVHKYRLLYQRLKFQFSSYEFNANIHKQRPFHEKALMRFREITKIGSNWDSAEILAKTEIIARRYSYDKEDYFVNLFGAYKFKEMFPKSWFKDGVELPFENIKLICPVEYDKVLTQMYGDYMTPPPEEQRTLHHCISDVSVKDDGNGGELR